MCSLALEMALAIWLTTTLTVKRKICTQTSSIDSQINDKTSILDHLTTIFLLPLSHGIFLTQLSKLMHAE